VFDSYEKEPHAKLKRAETHQQKGAETDERLENQVLCHPIEEKSLSKGTSLIQDSIYHDNENVWWIRSENSGVLRK